MTLDVKDMAGRGRGQRGHAVGGRLRRAVAHRLRAAGCGRRCLRAQGAAGHEHRQPPAHRVAARAHAQGRHRRRRWRRGCRCGRRAQGLPGAGVLARFGRDRRRRAGRRSRSRCRSRSRPIASWPWPATAARASDRAAPRCAPTSRSRSPPPSRASSPWATRRIFGAVVGSQLPAAGTAIVSMRSLDPGGARRSPAPPSSAWRSAPAAPSRCASPGAARAIGRARVQMTARVGDETDAFQDVIPVEILASPETVAAYGDGGRRHDHRARDGHDSARGRAGLRRARPASCRPRRWSASARARATWSSIPTAAPSRRRRRRWRSSWPRISATRSRCPA